MTHYAALDVSLRSVHICVIDTEGKIKAEAKLPSEVEDICTYLQGLNLEIVAVDFEAGTLTQYLDYDLKAAGFEVVCMGARQVKAVLSAMRNKTDKHDARGIAQILRSGRFREVHVKSLQSHQIRALLSSRKAVLAKCVDLENEIRGLFKVFGIKRPPRLGHGAFDGAVRETIEVWGRQLAKKRGHRRAVIAVARKLAVILHRMWIDETPFQWRTEGQSA